MKSKLSILTLVLSLCITASVGASEGTCIQGNCKNGYGIIIFDDGSVYEGQWKKGLFDGMGKLIFPSSSSYTGEFKKGLMHGYGKINLPNGSEKKCEVINGEIQVDESTRQLWLKETTSEIDEYIVYLKIGDVYRKHRDYEKSLEYYNKSLSINPDYIEAINNKNEVEEKIAELEAKAKAQEAPKIVFKGSAGTGSSGTTVYGSGGTSSAKGKSSGTTIETKKGDHVPKTVRRLLKSGSGSGYDVSNSPVFTPNSYK